MLLHLLGIVLLDYEKVHTRKLFFYKYEGIFILRCSVECAREGICFSGRFMLAIEIREFFCFNWILNK